MEVEEEEVVRFVPAHIFHLSIWELSLRGRGERGGKKRVRQCKISLMLRRGVWLTRSERLKYYMLSGSIMVQTTCRTPPSCLAFCHSE